jgi:hypothetical protein
MLSGNNIFNCVCHHPHWSYKPLAMVFSVVGLNSKTSDSEEMMKHTVNTDSLKKISPHYHNYIFKNCFKICLFNYLHFILYHCYVNFIIIHYVIFCFTLFFILENGLHCMESRHLRCDYPAPGVSDGHSMGRGCTDTHQTRYNETMHQNVSNNLQSDYIIWENSKQYMSILSHKHKQRFKNVQVKTVYVLAHICYHQIIKHCAWMKHNWSYIYCSFCFVQVEHTLLIQQFE